MIRNFVCLTFVVAFSIASAHADQWRGFHGLDRAGVVPDGELPTSWSPSDYKWRFELGTRDLGSVAVMGSNVYLLSVDPDNPEMRLLSIDLNSGKQNWVKRFPHANNHLHKRNTLASSTPAVDEDYVYIAHSDREHTWVRCLDHDGKEVWARDFGTAVSQHGFGTSPVIHGDTLILNFSQQADRVDPGQSPGTSRVIAMNRGTGKTIWETPVTTRRVCYGTPRIHNGMVLCANTGDGLYALSLENGEMLWRLPVFEMRCVSSPIIAGDLAIGSSGSGGGGNHLVAVRMPKQPGQKPEQVYRIDRGAPYVPTSVVKDGLMFMVDDKGIATCLDVQTGEQRWLKRVGGVYSASPVLIGDKVLLINLEGEATIISASDSFKEIGKLNLGGSVGATPAYVDGKLLLRIGTELVCL